MSLLDSGALITLFLAVAMLFTGTINTLVVFAKKHVLTTIRFLCVTDLTATKFQDLRVVKGIGDGPPTPFEHPFSQTAAMFLGELLCLFVYKLTTISFFSKKEKVDDAEQGEQASLITGDQLATPDASAPEPKKPQLNPLILWIPALCDLGGTTLLNVGLFLTYASVYQMLRGIVVVFNGLFSMIFLKQRLFYHHWGGISLIVVGTCIVGLNTILYPQGEGADVPRNPLLGNILVISAQVLAAIQFVVEEKFLSKYDAPPLQVVGWEGFWGLSMCTVILFVLYWIPGADYGSMENAIYGLAQCYYDWKLLAAVLGSVFSIAFFNFFGISITKRISSTTRSTIDSLRTFLIWIVSLIIGWEHFSWLQIGGFAVLVLGSSIYNEVLKIPFYHAYYQKRKSIYLENQKNARIEKEQRDADRKIMKRKVLQQRYLDQKNNYGSNFENAPTN